MKNRYQDFFISALAKTVQLAGRMKQAKKRTIRKETAQLAVQLFICLILGLLAFLFWLFYLTREPVFLSNPDSAKFAEVARNLKNGRGLTLNYSLCKKEITDEHCFIFTSPPLYPIVISFFMRVFGENDRAVIYTSGFFYICSILLIYFLAKKLFNAKIAFFSALTLIFTEQFLFHSISGTAETFFSFLLLLSFLFIANKTMVSLIFASIVWTFLILTKIQGIVYLPFFAFLVFLNAKEKKWHHLLFYLLPIIFLSFILKKLRLVNFIDILNYLLSKRTISYFLFYNSPVFPSGSLDQISHIPFLFQPIFKQVVLKFIENLYTVFKNILNITNPFIMVLFFLSFLKKERRENYLLKLLTLFLFSFFLLTGTIGVFNIRYSHPVFPLIIIFSVAMFFEIVKRLEVEKKELFTIVYFLVFIVLFSLTQINLGAKILKKDKNVDKPSIYYLLGKRISEISKEDEIVGTNLEIWGSWYGKRKTVLVPAEIKDLLLVDKIFLTSFSPGTEMSPAWQDLFDKPKDFDNYKFVKKITIPAESNYQNIPVTVAFFKRTK